MNEICPVSWVSPKQIVDEQIAKVSQELTKRLPFVIKELVLSYSFPPPWYAILEKINALPAKVPPFTQTMERILASPCPIYGAPYTLSDSFNLYLLPVGQVPAGVIETIGHLIGYSGVPEIILASTHLFFATVPDELRRFERSLWILVSKQWIPGSENKTRDQQMEMIEQLNNISGLHFECPLFKEAMGVTCLEIRHSGKGLWLNPEKATYTSALTTRVQECYITTISNGQTQDLQDIIVGSLVQTFPHAGIIDHQSAHSDVGAAAVLKFPLEPEPISKNASCCAVS